MIFTQGAAAAKSNNDINKSNADTSNAIRRENNRVAAAQGHLGRWMQAVTNGRILKDGGEAMTASTVNFNRSMDQETLRQFSDGIAGAEAMGAAIAAQAASGTSGSVADSVNSATALRNAIVEGAQDERVEQVTGDQRQRQASIASQVIGGLDSSVLLDQIDHGRDVAMQQAVLSNSDTMWRAVGTAALNWVTAGGAQAVIGNSNTQQQTNTAAASTDAGPAAWNDRRDGNTIQDEVEASKFAFSDTDYGDYL